MNFVNKKETNWCLNLGSLIVGVENKLKKTSKTKIAAVYSTALFDAAKDAGCLDKVLQDVKKLQVLAAENSDLVKYFSCPLWSEEDKVSVLDKIAKISGIGKETLSCLKVMSENNRMGNLGLMLDEFLELYYKENNIVEINVETVCKLSAAQDKKLQKTLEEFLAKKVVLNYIINPSIMGGLRITYGSQMFDDTLATKINYLEKLMKGK